MFVARHAVDTDHLTNLYHRDCRRLREYVDFCRNSPHLPISLVDIAETVYRAGSVVSPDDSEVPQAIRLEAQSTLAMFAFAEITDPPRFVRIGEGPPITFSVPVDESLLHGSRWTRGFDPAIISRQADLVSEFIAVPTNLLRQSSTRGTELTYQYVDLKKAIWTDPNFHTTRLFAEVEAGFALNAASNNSTGRAMKQLTLPYFQVLRALGSRDETQFAETLSHALKLHKKFWSTPKRRGELEGVISSPLTTVASLAWDRGMRFDVESDYIPTSWVRGDIFRETA